MKVLIVPHADYYVMPAEELRAEYPDLTFVEPQTDAERLREVVDTDAFFGTPTSDEMRAAKRLRWIHNPGMGIDRLTTGARDRRLRRRDHQRAGSSHESHGRPRVHVHLGSRALARGDAGRPAATRMGHGQIQRPDVADQREPSGDSLDGRHRPSRRAACAGLRHAGLRHGPKSHGRSGRCPHRVPARASGRDVAAHGLAGRDLALHTRDQRT